MIYNYIFFRYMHIYIDQWIYSHILPFLFLLLLCFTFHTKLLFSRLFCKWSVLSERFVNFIVLHYASSMLIMTSKSSIFFIYYISYDIIITASLRYIIIFFSDICIYILINGNIPTFYRFHFCYYCVLRFIQSFCFLDYFVNGQFSVKGSLILSYCTMLLQC